MRLQGILIKAKIVARTTMIATSKNIRECMFTKILHSNLHFFTVSFWVLKSGRLGLLDQKI